MVDFEHYRTVSLREMLKTGGSAHGGLTVRDYFAAKVLHGLISKPHPFAPESLACEAYCLADAMMKEREKPVQKPTPTVEEAFGLDK